MTVQELIDRLQREDPEAEVRLMTQPSYPFDNAISGVWTPEPVEPPSPYCADCGQTADAPMHADGSNEDESPFVHDFIEDSPETFRPSDDFSQPHDGPVVYITEGSQNGYGSREAWS